MVRRRIRREDRTLLLIGSSNYNLDYLVIANQYDNFLKKFQLINQLPNNNFHMDERSLII